METESAKRVKDLLRTWLFVFEGPAIQLYRTRSHDFITFAGMVETPIGIVNCHMRIQVFVRSEHERYLQVALKARCRNMCVLAALGFKDHYIWDEGWLIGYLQGENFIMRKPLKLLP